MSQPLCKFGAEPSGLRALKRPRCNFCSATEMLDCRDRSPVPSEPCNFHLSSAYTLHEDSLICSSCHFSEGLWKGQESYQLEILSPRHRAARTSSSPCKVGVCSIVNHISPNHPCYSRRVTFNKITFPVASQATRKTSQELQLILGRYLPSRWSATHHTTPCKPSVACSPTDTDLNPQSHSPNPPHLTPKNTKTLKPSKVTTNSSLSLDPKKQPPKKNLQIEIHQPARQLSPNP